MLHVHLLLKHRNQNIVAGCNKATEKDPKFYTLHLKAKIQAKMNDCKGATETAQKSIELAKVAKNDEYVKMNEKLIAECKGKK